MATDMLVALGDRPETSALHGGTLFACAGDHPVELALVPGGDHAPGDTDRAGLPEVRHTWAVLAGRAADGYSHGVNERGVVAGWAPIPVRLDVDHPALTAGELVRLALERAASACQAVEIVTDLICRHGQEGGSALLIADCREAYLIEAAGAHWALAQVGKRRAVAPACMLRQDWDRISRGLSDLAIARGWWPDDGNKFDFASAIGREGADHAQALRRWGRATIELEHHACDLDVPLVRRILRDQRDEFGAAFVAKVGPEPGDLPLAWHALGPAALRVHVPVFVCGEPPAHLGRLDREMREAAELMSGRPAVWATLPDAALDLQGRLDEYTHDFIDDARQLHRLGRADELRRLATSFMQHAAERVEDLLDSLRERPARRSVAVEVLQGADF